MIPGSLIGFVSVTCHPRWLFQEALSIIHDSLVILKRSKRRVQRNQRTCRAKVGGKVVFLLKLMAVFKEKLKQPFQTIVLVSSPGSVVPNIICDIILSGQMAF